jgi:hypothetical protein
MLLCTPSCSDNLPTRPARNLLGTVQSWTEEPERDQRGRGFLRRTCAGRNLRTTHEEPDGLYTILCTTVTENAGYGVSGRFWSKNKTR